VSVSRARLPALIAALALGAVMPLATWTEMRFGRAIVPPSRYGPEVSHAQVVFICVGALFTLVSVWLGRFAEFDRMRRLLAWLAVGGACVAVVLAVTRAGRVDREAYLAVGMPVVGVTELADSIAHLAHDLDAPTIARNPQQLVGPSIRQYT
jgi:hypothetical protein